MTDRHNSAAPSGALLLSEVGACLYGPQWQSPLGRASNVNLRTMQRWAAGQSSPPYEVWSELLVLLRQREHELQAVMNKVRRLVTR